MRTVHWLVGAALAAAVVAWWAMGADTPRPSSAAPANGASPAGAARVVDGEGGAAAGGEVLAPVSRTASGISPNGALRPITGFVTGPDGRGIAGALVVAEASLADDHSLLDPAAVERHAVADVRCGGDGAFALPLPLARTFLLRATAAGFAPAARGGVRAGARVDFTLAPPAVLVGTVRRVDDGRPVPGTRVEVHTALDFGGAVRTGAVDTDVDGRYRIDGLPPGPARVAVTPRELASPRDADVMLAGGPPTVLDVMLTAGVAVRGRVLDDATLAPIAGARVREGWVGRTVTTDDAGRFVMPGFAAVDNDALRVAADGYADAEVVLRDGGPDVAMRTDVEVRLVRGRRAKGRVLGPDGRPAAGVYVAAVAADHGANGRHFRIDWRATTSAADGEFAIDRLKPDMPHTLFLLRAACGTTLREFPNDEGQRELVDLGDVRLHRAASLRGRVVDERGAPIAAREVVLRGHNADRFDGARSDDAGYRAVDSYVAERRCRTGDDGGFEFADVAAGTYVVATAAGDSHRPIEETRTVGAGDAIEGVELRVFLGLSIAGDVFVADGGALPKCYCSIDPEEGQRTSADVEVDANGRFVARGLEPGTYSITVYPYASAADQERGRSFAAIAHEHVAAGSAAFRAEVPVRLPIGGLVLDALRAPAVGAPVGIRDGEQVIDSGVTGADGRFRLAAPFGRDVEVLVCRPVTGGETPFDPAGAVVRTRAAGGAPPLELVLPAR